ncbi:hypothetical protein BG011_006639 [Mortierella polycephala]|uniref:Uncharacterized protein n=1 Tax=Mortierella polycephala TaxID=41804 RepID=A0A9P6PUD7_9FUNG|nr:hypothetical protein BG011_006639 [Mortierella polycephala]
MTKGRPSRAAKQSAEEKLREFVLPNALTDSESDGDTFKLPTTSKKQPDHRSSTSRTESSSQKLKQKDNGNNGSLGDKDDSDESDGSLVDPRKKQMEAKTIGSKGKRPAKGAISIGAGQKRIRKEQDSDKDMEYREDEDDDGEDEYESDEESSKGKARQTKKRKGDDDADESDEDMQPLKKVRMEALLRGTYTHGHRKTPLLPLLQSMAMQEARRSRMLALTVLDGVKDDETYRWPVREALLPAVPKSSYVNASALPNHFELQGMGFVEELTGVPKKEEDYSDSDQEEGDEEEYDSALEEELLNRRRQEKRELKNQRRQRHEDEHSANERLEQVQQFMKDEITAFAQNQYRKGASHRIKDLYSLQRRTMPDSQIRAVRSMIGSSNTGEEQLDELTPIQENATRFAAEDSLRSILDRLPYVIRQGALGRMPEYAELGLPKPAMAHYERGWDTIMASATLAGVDDRILKRVGLRMKLLLSQSRQSRYYEPPPEAKFATGHT